MKKIIKLTLVAIIASIGLVANAQVVSDQTNTHTDSHITKAIDYFKSEGFAVSPNGNNMIATSDDLSINFGVIHYEKLSLLRMSSQLASYTETTDTNALSLVNYLNSNVPIVKFIATATQLGDYALVNGGDPTDVMYMVIAAVDQYYSTEDAMLQILSDYVKQFKAIKNDMPKTLNQ